jgi:nitroreductase
MSSTHARPDHPVHDLVLRRWSPYAFSDRSVPSGDLKSLFEAARWAASSYNEQPWRYLVATREDATGFARLLSCLVDGNQEWARHVPVLALGCYRLKFSKNGKPNGVALHDLGQASAQLTLEATARGLVVHQMAGILPDKARLQYRIPEDFQPITALAIGYAAEPETSASQAPDPLRQRDASARERKPLDQFVFSGEWGEPADIAR